MNRGVILLLFYLEYVKRKAYERHLKSPHPDLRRSDPADVYQQTVTIEKSQFYRKFPMRKRDRRKGK